MLLFNIGQRKIVTSEGVVAPQGQIELPNNKEAEKLMKLYPSELAKSIAKTGESAEVEKLKARIAELEAAAKKTSTKVEPAKAEPKTAAKA